MLAIVCCGVCAQAQDRIHLLDSRRVIEAKVIEIGEVDIIYRLYNNLEGPDYRLSTSRIESIDFENGTRQLFAGRRGFATGPYADGYMDGYDDGCLDYRWGHYYLHDRRIRRQELTDYIGYSLYGGKYRKASNNYFWGMALTGYGVLALIAYARLCPWLCDRSRLPRSRHSSLDQGRQTVERDRGRLQPQLWPPEPRLRFFTHRRPYPFGNRPCAELLNDLTFVPATGSHIGVSGSGHLVCPVLASGFSSRLLAENEG